MSKLEELRERIINAFGNNEYNVGIRINTEENCLIAIYHGHRVCKITDWYDFDGIYFMVFADNFIFEPHLSLPESCTCVASIAYFIEQRIKYYNKKKDQEVKNMAKRRFIVEKMEVEQRCIEPDVINMTIRKAPDGIDGQTARELKTLIESVDPDKLSSDYRINVNVDNDTVQKSIYMMTARGSGKTRWISEMLKNSFPFKDHIKDVIFNDPATIVFWVDGSKTVVKCQKGETFDPEKGLAMAISKKVLGNGYGYYETFAKYVGRYNKKRFNKALEEAKKITPDEVIYNGKKYILADTFSVKSKEE